MSSRAGLTRVDVLISLLAIVVAAGLVLAVVSRVREASVSTTCRNNLKQLGLAMHNYVDTNGRLPPLVDQGEGAPTGRGLPSVFAHLVPYMGATPLRFRPERSSDHYIAHSSVPITVPHMEES